MNIDESKMTANSSLLVYILKDHISEVVSDDSEEKKIVHYTPCQNLSQNFQQGMPAHYPHNLCITRSVVSTSCLHECPSCCDNSVELDFRE